MDSDEVVEKEVCPSGGEYCHPDDKITVQKEQSNSARAPVLVIGGIALVLGFMGGNDS